MEGNNIERNGPLTPAAEFINIILGLNLNETQNGRKRCEMTFEKEEIIGN
jgi:hypothetical protein